ncbi:hypothetical protein DPMN_143168 [Dreissena polymorpha]|uniref:Uncharacterized protein n=1 Tax=Dreissena polymorpha TaxID=45954 RepID=A0A9D4GFV4_DREPO|nr:hypothetical protein DPMN_143168 [Dreissena polymorpha]
MDPDLVGMHLMRVSKYTPECEHVSHFHRMLPWFATSKLASNGIALPDLPTLADQRIRLVIDICSVSGFP